MKLFGRHEEGSATRTLHYFWMTARKERGTVIRFSLEITINHVLRFVALPLILSLFVQALVTGASSDHLYVLIGIGIAVAGLSTYLNSVGFDRMFNHEERAQNDLTKLAVTNLLGHSYQFFSNKRVGTLAGDAMGFAKAYKAFFDISFMTLNSLAVGLIAGLIVIAVMAPILLLPLSLLLTALTILSIRSLKQRAPYRNERKKRTSKLTGIIADIMGNQLLTKVFAREIYEEEQVLRDREQIEQVAYKEIRLVKRDVMYRQIAVYAFQFVTLFVIVWLVSRGAISVAALVFIVTYIMRVTDSMFSISALIRQLEQVFLDAAPMIKILDKAHDIVDQPDAKKLVVTRGAITCKDVTFSYEDATTDSVFRNLQLVIPAGQRVGLAGPSGGGKTTLTKLLLRFADIDSGSIAIDDQDIRRVTQKSLREAISYVPQEPLLFHRALRENIAYGCPEASDEEIINATKQAHAWEFIDKLPNGLDTIVGERGVKLSGGQRQRIAIARAILKDAPILILDEATSALDSESEQLIQSALENLMQNRTSIVIAHRLSTIAKLDRIIVMDNGEIIEDGTHESLRERGGMYAKLWRHQSGGFIEE